MVKFLLYFISCFIISLFYPIQTFAQSPDNFAEDEIIVKLKSNVAKNKLEELNLKLGTRIWQKLILPQTYTLKVPKSQVLKYVGVYGKNPLVEYAEPNYKVYVLETPNDTYFPNQWGMIKVWAPQAFDITHGLSAVKIAIADTGIDKDHEDLSSKVVDRINFTDSPTDDDLYGHGTHVAGIAAAITNNNLGVAGLGYQASLMSVKVLDDTGSGYYSWVASGIRWAADNGARAINLSLGGSSASSTLSDAVNYAWSKGVVLACAAGNSGNSSRTYPGFYSNCIATAATDQNDRKASWSSYGNWVDVAAPGVNIFSTFPNHPYSIGKNLSYDYGSGTSMATPHVAGLAGLLFGYNSALTASHVRSVIETYADDIPGTGTYWSKGRINAYRALLGLTSSPTPTPTPTSTPTPAPSVEPTPSPTPTPTPEPSAACWSSSNQYLYRNNNQAKKFCKCAQGSYGYNSYKYNWERQTVYYYSNAKNNENWATKFRSSYYPIYEVTCTNGQAYSTKQNYYFP